MWICTIDQCHGFLNANSTVNPEDEEPAYETTVLCSHSMSFKASEIMLWRTYKHCWTTPQAYFIAHAWTLPYAELPSNRQKRGAIYEVEKPSSTSPLSSATTINNSNENCTQVIRHCYLTVSLQLRELESCIYATSLHVLMKFWLQYCCSYTDTVTRF